MVAAGRRPSPRGGGRAGSRALRAPRRSHAGRRRSSATRSGTASTACSMRSAMFQATPHQRRWHPRSQLATGVCRCAGAPVGLPSRWLPPGSSNSRTGAASGPSSATSSAPSGTGVCSASAPPRAVCSSRRSSTTRRRATRPATWSRSAQTGVVTSSAWVAEPLRNHPLDRPFAWALVTARRRRHRAAARARLGFARSRGARHARAHPLGRRDRRQDHRHRLFRARTASVES